MVKAQSKFASSSVTLYRLVLAVSVLVALVLLWRNAVVGYSSGYEELLEILRQENPPSRVAADILAGKTVSPDSTEHQLVQDLRLLLAETVGLRREGEESALAQGKDLDVASLQRMHQKTGERFATLSRMIADYRVVELQQDLLANIVFDINPPSFGAFSEVGEMWPAFGALLILNPDSEIIVQAFEDAERKYRANALGMLLVKLRGSEEARNLLEGKGPKGFIVTYDPVAEILRWDRYPIQQHSSNSVSRAQGINRDPD